MILRVSLWSLVAATLAATSAHGQSTWSQEVSRLVQAKCQGCHRPGDIGPFSLVTYADIKAQLSAIRSAVTQRRMPPWKPSAGDHAFAANFGLSDAERQLLLDWIAAGAPEGDPAALPAPLPVAGDWQLGPPDLVVPMFQPYRLPDGGDTYRCFSLPFDPGGDRWLRALQVLPGTRSVVHHALVFADPAGASLEWEGKDGQPGYSCFGDAGEGVDELLGAWVPGARVLPLPDDVGIPVTGSRRLVLQLHYHQHGVHGAHHPEEITDLTRVGLYFTPRPPAREMLYFGLETDEIDLPAGAVGVETGASEVIPIDVDILTVGPHMHLLGRQIRLELTPPGAGPETLIAIDDWDFDYQGFYQYERAVAVPADSRLSLRCRYDNSEANPRNPNTPPKRVTYGEGTEDEMCLAFLGVVLPEGLLDQARPARRAPRARAMRPRRLPH